MIFKRLFVFLRHSFGDTDSTCRTDQSAEVTANALGAYQMGLTGRFVKDDGLVTTVATRHLTATATDTHFLVKLRIDNRFAIQMVRL